ncbi:MAG TPA: type II toxin-antitoxin system HicA family toxin [bacterium]|nr:type II toxin-antitoxin system HicA family toxin [bacterium]
MPKFGPVSRRDLVKFLRQCGFDGPYSGGNHAFMIQGDLTLSIPNPHVGDIGRDLLARILRQANISKQRWESLQ